MWTSQGYLFVVVSGQQEQQSEGQSDVGALGNILVWDLTLSEKGQHEHKPNPQSKVRKHQFLM